MPHIGYMATNWIWRKAFITLRIQVVAMFWNANFLKNKLYSTLKFGQYCYMISMHIFAMPTSFFWRWDSPFKYACFMARVDADATKNSWNSWRGSEWSYVRLMTYFHFCALSNYNCPLSLVPNTFGKRHSQVLCMHSFMHVYYHEESTNGVAITFVS